MLQRRSVLPCPAALQAQGPASRNRLGLAILAGLLAAPGLLAASQTGGDSSYVVTKHRVEVIGYGGRIDQVLGEFDNPDDAADCERKWSMANPNDLRLTRSREVQVRITPARPGTPRPRQDDPVPSVPRPGGGRPAATALPNSTWSGGEDLQGYGRLTFDFRADGTVTMRDSDGAAKGTWRQTGRQVTLFFYNGRVVYGGTIDGEVISGNAGNGKKRWKWRVQIN